MKLPVVNRIPGQHAVGWEEELAERKIIGQGGIGYLMYRTHHVFSAGRYLGKQAPGLWQKFRFGEIIPADEILCRQCNILPDRRDKMSAAVIFVVHLHAD